jgi:2-polyprenyl-3-methyl-5-hydroxy-6-metoxy-1,4-benzoquinol methylase
MQRMNNIINPTSTNSRKSRIKFHADSIAHDRDQWISKNSFFYENDHNYMRFLVPKGARVIDIGCGTGELLSALEPSYGLGIDLSSKMVEVASGKYPSLHFKQMDVEDKEFATKIGMKFDYIILSDTIGLLDDIGAAFDNLHELCNRETRIIIAYHSPSWASLLSLGEYLGLRMPQPPVNYISSSDFDNILDLSEFEAVRFEYRQLMPYNLFGLGNIINKYFAPLPIINKFGLRTYVAARSLIASKDTSLTTTVLIPCRNEKGNIETAIQRLPDFGKHLEVIYVEGNSRDGTYEECLRVRDAYPEKDIKVFKQEGKGKGDAVRKGFSEASGDILMILDADLTVPPEVLPKFYTAISHGKAEFVNGTRLVYPMESQAMRPLNFIANRFFASVFSFLISQRFTDTLCGTKVLLRSDYFRIASQREYFGDFDPFGDFDLILGASKLNLKIVEVPVQYAARVYGETQISRFRDGALLLRMVLFAYNKLKAI